MAFSHHNLHTTEAHLRVTGLEPLRKLGRKEANKEGGGKSGREGGRKEGKKKGKGSQDEASCLGFYLLTH